MTEGGTYYRLVARHARVELPLTPDVARLRLEQRIDAATALIVVLEDRFRLLGHALREGIAIELVQGDTEEIDFVFTGSIYRVEATFSPSAPPTLTITAYDDRMALGLRRRTRTLSPRRLSAMIQTLAHPSFPRSDVSVELRQDPELSHGLHQAEESDLTTLFRLADAYNAVLLYDVQSGQLRFVDMASLSTAQPLRLVFGRPGTAHILHRFDGTSSIERRRPRQVSGIAPEPGTSTTAPDPHTHRVEHFDPPLDDDDPLLGEHLARFATVDPDRTDALDRLIDLADALEFGERLEPTRIHPLTGFTTAPEGQALAGSSLGIGQSGQVGHGIARGDFRLQPAERVRLAGVGRFTGEWMLTETTHRLDDQGFTTEFTCRR